MKSNQRTNVIVSNQTSQSTRIKNNQIKQNSSNQIALAQTINQSIDRSTDESIRQDQNKSNQSDQIK